MVQNSQQKSSETAYASASIPTIFLNAVTGANNNSLLDTPFNAGMVAWFYNDTTIWRETGTPSVLKHSLCRRFLMNPESLNIRTPARTLQQQTTIDRPHSKAM